MNYAHEMPALTAEDIVKSRLHLIVKDLFKEVFKTNNRINRCREKISSSSLCDGTNRYWKAQENLDASIREKSFLLHQLLQLDVSYRWTEKLHQDRYSFVTDYVAVLVELNELKHEEGVRGMPKPVKVDLEAVEQNPDRASIKYGNKAVVQKMYSITKSSLEKWLALMQDTPQFSSGVIHPTHKIVLIELDVFDEFVRWMDKNRYKKRKGG